LKFPFTDAISTIVPTKMPFCLPPMIDRKFYKSNSATGVNVVSDNLLGKYTLLISRRWIKNTYTKLNF